MAKKNKAAHKKTVKNRKNIDQLDFRSDEELKEAENYLGSGNTRRSGSVR